MQEENSTPKQSLQKLESPHEDTRTFTLQVSGRLPTLNQWQFFILLVLLILIFSGKLDAFDTLLPMLGSG